MPRSASASCVIVLLLLLLAPIARAQEPDRIEPVRFDRDHLVLVGEVHLPDGPGPHPGIVLLHGSAPAPRSSPIYQAIAGFFAERGLATLVFDKRGVGESAGTYVETPPFEQTAGDGLAALRALAARPDVDGDRVGVWGVSQGGWIGPLMAATSDDVAFVISVSGPGVSPFEQSLYQDRMELVEDGWSEHEATEAIAVRRATWRYWQTGEGRAEAEAAVERAKAAPWFERTGWRPAVRPREEVDDASKAWLEVASYDPVSVAERVTVPVLHVYGGKDRHIPVAASVDALTAAYARGGNADAAFVLFPEGGHGIQRVAGEWQCIDCPHEMHDFEPVPGYLEVMAGWLEARLRPAGP